MCVSAYIFSFVYILSLFVSVFRALFHSLTRSAVRRCLCQTRDMATMGTRNIACFCGKFAFIHVLQSDPIHLLHISVIRLVCHCFMCALLSMYVGVRGRLCHFKLYLTFSYIQTESIRSAGSQIGECDPKRTRFCCGISNSIDSNMVGERILSKQFPIK